MSDQNMKSPSTLDESQRLLLIEERIRNPILITDYEGLITWCNDAFTTIMGYTTDEVMGAKLGHFLIGPKTEAEIIEKLNAALASKTDFDGEIYYYAKNGKGRWFAISTSPILGENNQFIGFIAIHTDITERKYTENELRSAKESIEIANQQLENANSQLEETLANANQMASEAAVANQIKDEFLGHISHAIHAPITQIADTLHQLSSSQLSPEQRQQTDSLISNVETLDTIIKDILQFYEIESGKLQIQRSPLDFRHCVEGTLKWIAEKSLTANQHIVCSIHELVPKNFLGDEKRLRQILINLLDNAIRFTEKGEISLTAESKSLEDKLHEIHFQIKDHGIGLSEEEINTLLQSFSPTPLSATKQKHAFGLAISKRLAELMGGSMWGTTEKDKGTTFHFTVVLEASS